jgi:hypothetical protein
MGTNYYVAKNMCECCNRYDEEYHIGKSSHGWAFTFQGYPAERIVSWRAWKEFLKNQVIVDEYGERRDYDWFVQFVENEKAPKYTRPDGHVNLQQNEEGRKPGVTGLPWFNPEYDWDDEDGYAFSARDFS